MNMALARLIAGRLQPTAGSVTCAVTLAYVAQTFIAEPGQTVADEDESDMGRDNEGAPAADERHDSAACADDDGENDEKDHGDDGKYLDIVPSGGKLILFDSSRVEHQVLASHGEDRYALTCWFNGDLVEETE